MRHLKKDLVIKVTLLFIGLGLLFWLVKHYNSGKIVGIVKRADFGWIFMGLVAYYLSILTRAMKWYNLLGKLIQRIGFLQFLPLYLINLGVASITPTRSGEFAAPFLFKRYINTSIGGGFCVILIDRLIEAIFLLLITSFSVIYTLCVFNLPTFLVRIFIFVFVTLTFMIVFLGFLFFSQKKIVRIFEYLERITRKKSLLAFIVKKIQRAKQELNIFYESSKIFRTSKILRFLISLTMLSWLFEISSFYFVMRSISEIPFMPVATSQILAKGFALASFIPSGLGSENISFTYMLSLGGYLASEGVAGSLLAKCLYLSSIFVFTCISLFVTSGSVQGRTLSS